MLDATDWLRSLLIIGVSRKFKNTDLVTTGTRFLVTAKVGISCYNISKKYHVTV